MKYKAYKYLLNEDETFIDLISTLKNLRGADLRGANLEYSCLPLQCSTSKIKIDKDNIQQLVKMIFSSECDWKEFNQIKKMKIYKKLIGE
jgi:hypothetical protein